MQKFLRNLNPPWKRSSENEACGNSGIVSILGKNVAIRNDSPPWPSFAEPIMNTENLNRDFLEFIALLEARGVDYLVVGGYAVALHGFPRYTGDIDFYVATSNDNSVKLLEVFNDFGFGNIGLQQGDFLEPDFVVEIGREPRKIQVLTGIDGVAFNECYARRVEVDLAGMKVKFIGKDDLIRNKKVSARSKDLIDVDQLEKG